jgi:hypothetical protein
MERLLPGPAAGRPTGYSPQSANSGATGTSIDDPTRALKSPAQSALGGFGLLARGIKPDQSHARKYGREIQGCPSSSR